MMILDLLRQQQPLLDGVFGAGTYRLEANEPHRACIRTGWMELSLVYDQRDQFVSSEIKPLGVPDDVAEYLMTDTLLRFCEVDVGPRRKSALDERQVADELSRIEPLVPLLKSAEKSQEASSFVRGYNAAYTDWAGGRWD